MRTIYQQKHAGEYLPSPRPAPENPPPHTHTPACLRVQQSSVQAWKRSALLPCSPFVEICFLATKSVQAPLPFPSAGDPPLCTCAQCVCVHACRVMWLARTPTKHTHLSWVCKPQPCELGVCTQTHLVFFSALLPLGAPAFHCMKRHGGGSCNRGSQAAGVSASVVCVLGCARDRQRRARRGVQSKVNGSSNRT